MPTETQRTHHREYMRGWRARNRERHAEFSRNWRVNNPAEYAAANRAWAKSNPKRKAAHSIASKLRKTGADITSTDVLLMLEAPACEACGASFSSDRDRQIDHCHATGSVRGVICGACNRALGMAKDCPVRLRALAEYIERSAMP